MQVHTTAQKSLPVYLHMIPTPSKTTKPPSLCPPKKNRSDPFNWRDTSWSISWRCRSCNCIARTSCETDANTDQRWLGDAANSFRMWFPKMNMGEGDVQRNSKDITRHPQHRWCTQRDAILPHRSLAGWSSFPMSTFWLSRSCRDQTKSWSVCWEEFRRMYQGWNNPLRSEITCNVSAIIWHDITCLAWMPCNIMQLYQLRTYDCYWDTNFKHLSGREINQG